MILDYLFLPPLVFIGLVTSYQDFRYGKIRNKWIIFGATWGIGIWLLLLGWSQLSHVISQSHFMDFALIMPSYILKVAVNSSISLVVGYLLWYFDLWSAGDAKLFFVISLLLPLKYYWKSAFPFFYSAILLINIFSFALVFLVFKSMFTIIKSLIKSPNKIRWEVRHIHQGKKYIIENYMTLIKATLIFFSALFIFQIIRTEIRLAFDIGQVNKWYLAIIFMLLSKTSKYVREFFKKIWLLVPIYLILIPYLLFTGFFSVPENISNFLHTMRNSLSFGLAFGALYFLLAIAKKNEKETHMPFAFWIFMGAIITIAIQGSLFSLFMKS
jgi:hypothetical protein